MKMSAPSNELTDREMQIACLIATGMKDKDIAAKLGITHLTVRQHVHKILKKLNLPNRTAIAIWHFGQV